MVSGLGFRVCRGLLGGCMHCLLGGRLGRLGAWPGLGHSLTPQGSRKLFKFRMSRAEIVMTTQILIHLQAVT